VTCGMYCVPIQRSRSNQVTAKETGRGLDGLGAWQPIQASDVDRAQDDHHGVRGTG
jgi:hypothetical protein